MSDKEHSRTVVWETSTPEAHEALMPPISKTLRDDTWGPIMRHLMEGKVIRMHVEDDDHRGYLRRAVGQRAGRVGFVVEMRDDTEWLSVRKTGDKEKRQYGKGEEASASREV